MIGSGLESLTPLQGWRTFLVYRIWRGGSYEREQLILNGEIHSVMNEIVLLPCSWPASALWPRWIRTSAREHTRFSHKRRRHYHPTFIRCLHIHPRTPGSLDLIQNRRFARNSSEKGVRDSLVLLILHDLASIPASADCRSWTSSHPHCLGFG